jgi:hypothetical protein
MIRFIEVVNETNYKPRTEGTSDPRFTLGEVWINEDYVVSIREALGYRSLLEEGLLPPDLENHHVFTTVVINNGQRTESYVVVGSPTTVAGRLSKNTHTLLKG